MANEPTISAKIKVTGQDDVRAAFNRMRSDADSTLGRVGSTVSTVGSAAAKTVTAASSAVGATVTAANVGFGLISSLVSGVTGAIGTAVGAVTQLAGSFGAAGALAGAGIGGLVFAAKSYAQSVSENISSAEDLGKAVGLSVDEITRLQSAVRLSGGDADKFGQGLEEMAKKVIALGQGNEQATESFGQLGLSIADFRDKKGNLVGTRQQLDILIDRLKAVKNPALQTNTTAVFLRCHGGGVP